ncbi:MAG: two-component system, OmpR family, alkaline phosphatase synthesis response regulator PhoP [Acidobacteriota bacterium]|nr:two-component system, OmpR family, alkaline phosphatase synthesis response regulator PhoP [Acidobacteriota bacterium]
MFKKIVIIEDEEQLGRLIQAYIEQHHYRAILVRDGVSGLNVIREQVPDLILMDLLLPRMHGFDICQSVKKEQRLQHIPIIVMTAVYRSAMDKMQARRLGVDEFVEKPLNFDELLKKIQRLTGTEPEPVATPTPIPTPQATPQPTPQPKPTSPPPPKPGTLPESGLESETGPQKVGTDIFEKHMQEIQQDYAAQLPDKIQEMEKLWATIKKGKDNKTRVPLFRTLAHKLTGSGATFGFPEITRDAQQLELLLDMIIAEGEETIEGRKEKIETLLDNLRLHPAVMTEKQLRKMKL